MSPETRRAPRWVRAVIPALLILVWFTAGSLGGPYFGKIDEVSSNDQTSYLPATAQATEVQQRLGEFREGDSIPAILLFESDSALTDAQLAGIDEVLEAIRDKASGVDPDGISPGILSEDGLAVQAFVPILADEELSDVIGGIELAFRDELPDGIRAYVTGPAGFSADLVAAFAGIDGLLLLVALAVVFLILIVVYRSPLLPLLVLSTSVFALTVSLLINWWLAYSGLFLLNGQVQGILFILVIGAATDYSLLYVARYREALRDHERRWDATWAALKGSLEPIVASGGTVIAGLLCLLLSDLNSNKALGPVAAVGVAVSVLAALTFLPALLLATGRAAFWPRRPEFGSAHPELVGASARGLWPAVGRFVAGRARIVWVASTVILLALGAGLFQLKAEGVPQSDLILGESQARDGQNALAEHFPGGSGTPVQVIVPEGDLQEVTDLLLAQEGVDSVAVASADSPSGSYPVTEDGIQPLGPPGTPVGEPTVSQGDVLLQATLAVEPDSDEAQQTVRDIRALVAEEGGGSVLVGGATATQIDTIDTSIHDRTLIIPIVLVVILLILMLLLRSVLAPVLLILSVIVSYVAALGVAAWVFEGVFGFTGADPAVPLFGFVFLVALGIDYNIFLMTRVREESLTHGTREGVLRGLSVTGGVITSAGIVLAATFAALGVIPVMFLAQIAFIVAFGVLLDTFLVRSLLVPALAYDLGDRIWWPLALSRRAASGIREGGAAATSATATAGAIPAGRPRDVAPPGAPTD